MVKQLTKPLLEKLKKALLREEKKLARRIEDLKSGDPFLDPDRVVDNAAVDTDVREQIGHETVATQVSALEMKRREIQRALERMKKKKYGICERCQKPIPLARLKLLPEARYCIDCEKETSN